MRSAAGSFFVVVLLAGLAAGASGAQTLATPEPRTAVEALVTIRVETSSGAWVRIAIRESVPGQIEILEADEKYEVRVRVEGGMNAVQVEFVPEVEIGSSLGRKRAQSVLMRGSVGFPNFPRLASVHRVDVESIEWKPMETGFQMMEKRGRPGPDLGDDDGVTSACCLTCSGVRACGCFVGGSCGSCCSCCEI